MANRSMRMDIIQKMIRFRSEGKGIRQIARILGISRNTVRKYLQRMAEAKGFDQLTPAEQRAIFYPLMESESREVHLQSMLPDLLCELKKPGVTRMLLWEEYIRSYPQGFSYGRFCDRIRALKLQQSATLRISHKPGYKLMIDFAGKKQSWVDKQTGEVRQAEILVCTLPYSGYTFAYAVASQKQEDFVEAINQAFLYLGGLPKVILSDNLKSYVYKADRYEPEFTELCRQFSMHYGLELDAARVAKPKDKASVERHVGIMYNQVLGPLRRDTFFSIPQINEAFAKQVEVLNNKKLQGKSYSRKEKFEQEEKPLLDSLPTTLFEIKKSTIAKVQRNYHVILGEDKHQYSVPYQYIGKQTQIIYTSSTVEIYLGVERIAMHQRDRRKHAYSSFAGHMPEKHLKYIEQRGWDAAYFRKQADRIGPAVRWAMDEILESKQILEQTYNSCLGVLRLEKKYGPKRLELACARAQTTHRVNYGILKNILKNGMDQKPLTTTDTLFKTVAHENIRGPGAYE